MSTTTTTNSLLSAVTSVGAGTGVQYTQPVSDPYLLSELFTVSITATGAFTAQVFLETSTTNAAPWTPLKFWDIQGNGSFYDTLASLIPVGTYVRASVMAISGTATAVTVNGLINRLVAPRPLGTTTNDAAPAGSVGELIAAATPGTTATVTITIAAPGVVTWTSHGLTVGSIVVFTTTGALPTGLTAATPYYVVSVPTASTFTVSATPNGTAITTSGTQSGTQTGTAAVALTTATAANIAAIVLTPGEWDVTGLVTFTTAVSTSVTQAIAGSSATSATLGADGTYARMSIGALVPGAVEWLDQIAPVTRVSVAVTTPLYLIAQSTFTVSTQTSFGSIRARRVS